LLCEPASAITAAMLPPKSATARRSDMDTFGFRRHAFSSSSSSVTTPILSMRNVPTPISVAMALPTYVFMPWMSDTTAMIDITATMLPSTIMKERSLFVQIASSAMRMASRI